MGWWDRQNVLEEVFDRLKGYVGGFAFSAMSYVITLKMYSFWVLLLGLIMFQFSIFGLFILSNHLIVNVYRNN